MVDSALPELEAHASIEHRYVQRTIHAENRTYTSIQEASRELGITVATVRNRLKRKDPGYYIEEVEVDRPVGLARKDGRPVILNGVHYLTMKAAAAALQATVAKLRRKIEVGEEGCFFVDEGQRADVRRDRRKSVLVDGKAYESIAAAAREMRISRGTMQARVQSPRFPNYKYQE